MKRVYSGKSDQEGYKHMTIYDDGSKVYFNDIKPSKELDRAFTNCWNSLPREKQIEINRKIELKRKEAENGYISRTV